MSRSCMEKGRSEAGEKALEGVVASPVTVPADLPVSKRIDRFRRGRN